MNIDEFAKALLLTEADAILAPDRDGLIRFWNPAARRIFGFEAEEAIGRSLDLFIPEALRVRHHSGFTKVMAGGETRYGSGDLLAAPALTKRRRRISVEFNIVISRYARRDNPHGGDHARRDGAIRRNARPAKEDCRTRSWPRRRRGEMT
jgi:PAS domain S-box-containing protein